ncbi:MAG: NUDIX domain-containing protein [Ramlibacter sp.]
MSSLVPDAAWLAALYAGLDQPPHRLRVPLWAGGAPVGSVEPDLLPRLTLRTGLAQEVERDGARCWEVQGDVTESLGEIAQALRDAGLAHTWRDEQLGVDDPQGRRLGTVERAVVRCLGVTTFAVHMVGLSRAGEHWVQQRSFTKPNDPGLWDTLVGGMVPASDSTALALERETWEEAGLRLAQLAGVSHGGRIFTRRPTDRGSAGYVVEYVDWYRCVIPDGVVPVNQDGEVAEFRLMASDEVLARLQRGEFTTEAALMLLQAGL